MKTFSHFTGIASEAIDAEDFSAFPSGLYDPIVYTMEAGAKRLRPALAVLASYLYSGDTSYALKPAIGLELFHNFTLLHDDIMDKAPIRRGKPTVYKKWDANTAILSGDTMFAIANKYICMAAAGPLPDILNVFNKTAIEVCEGQQMDMDFESMEWVEESDYIKMITLKTAVLIAGSLSIGAYCGGAGKQEAKKLYEVGRNLGIAFQLKDDLLDVYGNSSEFGKICGGDIIANKKTYLYIKAIQNADMQNKARILELYKRTNIDTADKINEVKKIFELAGAEQLTVKTMNKYHDEAVQRLNGLSITAEGKSILRELAGNIISRKY